MSHPNSSKHGFSLVEVIIGITLTVFILVVSLLALKSFNKGSVSLQFRDYANQALDAAMEQVRNEAASNFDGMDETVDKDRSGLHYPMVIVKGTVFPAVARTRNVSLTAYWKEGGQPRSKTIHESVGYTRKKDSGAILKLRIVNAADTTEGISGALVKVQGLDQHEFQVASSSGVVQISGVLPSATGVEVKISGATGYITGEWAGFHFAPNDVPWYRNTIYTSTGVFRTPPTVAGSVLDLSTAPVRMHPPGSIEARVIDAVTGRKDNLGTNPTLYMIPRDGTLIMQQDLGWSDTWVTLPTSAQGVYKWKNLVPGQYKIWFYGSYTYALTGVPNDMFENTNNGTVTDCKRDYISLNSGDKKIYTMKSLACGSLKGSVRSIKYNAGEGSFNNGVETAPDPTNSYTPKFKLALERENTKSYWGNMPIDLSRSMPGDELPSWDPGVDIISIQTNGSYAMDNFTPAILDLTRQSPYSPCNSDPDALEHPMTEQYNLVRVKASNFTRVPAPLTPIMVLNGNRSLGGNGMTFLLQGDSASKMVGEGLASNGIQDDGRYRILVYPAIGSSESDKYRSAGAYGWSPTTSQKIYFLDKSQYRNISGYVVSYADQSSAFAPTDIDKPTSHVYVDWSDGGYGGLIISSNSTCLLKTNYEMKTPFGQNWPTGGGASNHKFSLSLSSSPALPPNIGSGGTIIKYMAYTIPTTPAFDHSAKVVVYYKKNDGNGNAVATTMTPSDVDGTLKMTGYTWMNNGPLWSETSVRIVDGNIDPADASHPTKFRYRYTGKSAPIGLNLWDDPAVAIPGVNTEVYLPVKDKTDDHIPTYVHVADSADWLAQQDSYAFSYTSNKYVGENINMNKVGQTGVIYGKVVASDGSMLNGVTVQLKLSTNTSGGYNTYTQVTAANACSQVSGGCPDGKPANFAFPAGYKFVMRLGSNYRLSVTGLESRGYNSPGDARREAYDGMRWRCDFYPSLINSGSGGVIVGGGL